MADKMPVLHHDDFPEGVLVVESLVALNAPALLVEALPRMVALEDGADIEGLIAALAPVGFDPFPATATATLCPLDLDAARSALVTVLVTDLVDATSDLGQRPHRCSERLVSCVYDGGVVCLVDGGTAGLVWYVNDQ